MRDKALDSRRSTPAFASPELATPSPLAALPEVENAMALAMEWGFKAAEKGWNYERAVIEFRKVTGRG